MEGEQHSDKFSAENLPADFVVAGRYKIIRGLGSGGMAAVYLARDNVLSGEKVAIKILRAEFVGDDKHTRRFLREVQLMRKINHPNVVRTYDVGADQDLVYFTMEYVIGKSFDTLLDDGIFPKEDIADITCQVCNGLQAIHDAHIIHRDLKPGNLLLLEDGTVKIADFGVARPKRSKLTAHNEVVGSATYMAPEIWLGNKLTNSVDIYSLGIILYELMTGDVPFDADSPAEMMRLHLDAEAKPPREVDKAVPAWLNRLILRLLEKSPVDRPKDANAVIALLNDYTERGFGVQQIASDDGGNANEAALLVSTLERISQRQLEKSRPAPSTAKQSSTQSQRHKFLFWKRKPAIPVTGSSTQLPIPHFRKRRFSRLLSQQINITAITLLAALCGIWLVAAIEAVLAPHLSSALYTSHPSLVSLLLQSLGTIAVHSVLFVLPLVVLASLRRTLRALIGAATIGILFFMAVGFFLSASTMSPLVDSKPLTRNTLELNQSAAIQQLQEVALLAPTNTKISSLANNQTPSAQLSVSIFSEPRLVALQGAYLLLISFICFCCIPATGRGRSLATLTIIGGLLTLLTLQHLSFHSSFIGLETYAFASKTLSLPLISWQASALNWGYLFVATAVFAFGAAMREES